MRTTTCSRGSSPATTAPGCCSCSARSTSAEQEWFLTLGLAVSLHYVEGTAYALEGLCAIAAMRGEGWRAGALAVVTATMRQSTGLFDVEGFAVHLAPLAALRERDPAGIEAGERAGADMSVAEAIALVLLAPSAARRARTRVADGGGA